MCNGAKTYGANRTTTAEKRQGRKARVASLETSHSSPLYKNIPCQDRPQQPFAHTQTKPVPDAKMT
ncbi:hypothetical protein DPMN_056753 [Dreissena polymorpha]|uniref:Uncharacterized protein n=1 Tax=Dreissena polymorpha TaxID=45954 RepID=A0A9D4CSA4_DREPO|nr:hypothetical protein DPMN_056753 [Dreissena polymorpha]